METKRPKPDFRKKLPKRKIEDFEVYVHPQKSTSDLGKGSYGHVQLVTDKKDPGKLYAMKIVSSFDLLDPYTASRSIKTCC